MLPKQVCERFGSAAETRENQVSVLRVKTGEYESIPAIGLPDGMFSQYHSAQLLELIQTILVCGCSSGYHLVMGGNRDKSDF